MPTPPPKPPTPAPTPTPARKFKTGARRSSQHALVSAKRFRPLLRSSNQVVRTPKDLTMLGNDEFGDCVTAEEGFKLQCETPQVNVGDQVVIDWARRHGVLDGADLASVLDTMLHDGFQVAGQRYNDGEKHTVDYTDRHTLESAIAAGPVKIAIASASLPDGAGNQQGWYAVTPVPSQDTDHCVSLSSYGPAEALFAALGVPCPSACAGKRGFLLYTWATQGFVSWEWLQGTCVEAWIRQPNTVGIPPLPGPPTPPNPPTPPVTDNRLVLSQTLPAGTYPVGPTTMQLAADLAAGTYPVGGGAGPIPADDLAALIATAQRVLAALGQGVPDADRQQLADQCRAILADLGQGRRGLAPSAAAVLERLRALPWAQLLALLIVLLQAVQPLIP